MGESIQSFVENALGITNGVFGVNAKEMIIQIVSTLLLFLVVRFFFWNKVTDYLEARKEAMTNEYDEAKHANDEAIEKRELAKGELNEIRVSAKGIFEDAKLRGETERKDILEKAKLEADKLVVEAHQEISSNIEKARSSINDEIVSVATIMAAKIIKTEIDEKKHKELIEDATKGTLN